MKKENHGALVSEQLMQFVSKIEKLNEDKAQIQADIKEIMSEAKSAGYDPKFIRYIIKLRKLDSDELDEADKLAVMYRNAAGINPGVAENA